MPARVNPHPFVLEPNLNRVRGQVAKMSKKDRKAAAKAAGGKTKGEPKMSARDKSEKK